MKKTVFSFLAVTLMSGFSLLAQTSLVETRFAEGPGFSLRPGLQPEPRVVVTDVADGPEGQPATVFHFDDSAASPGSAGYYLLTLPFPRQEEGVVTLKMVLRIPAEGVEGGNRNSDFRIYLGGKNSDESYPSASYIRVMSGEGEGRWSVYEMPAEKHRQIDVPLIPGDWYLLEKRLSLATGTYDWSLRSLSNEGQSAEGSGEHFYQAAENLSLIAIASLERGGAFEVAEVKVELE